jgi:hypothetical protein
VPRLSTLIGILANSTQGYPPSAFVDLVSTATEPDTRAGQGVNPALATWVSAINFWAWNMIGPLSTTYAGDPSLSNTEASMLVATPILVGSVGRGSGVVGEAYNYRPYVVYRSRDVAGKDHLVSSVPRRRGW